MEFERSAATAAQIAASCAAPSAGTNVGPTISCTVVVMPDTATCGTVAPGTLAAASVVEIAAEIAAAVAGE